jgi:hypothetical protein
MTDGPQPYMSLDEALEYVKTLSEDQQKIFELAFVAGMSKQAQSSVDRAVNAVADDKHYELGWNAALEMAATKLVHDFSKSFGADTCASWASWLKEQKK